MVWRRYRQRRRVKGKCHRKRHAAPRKIDALDADNAYAQHVAERHDEVDQSQGSQVQLL
jgi:hypothetical protein